MARPKPSGGVSWRGMLVVGLPLAGWLFLNQATMKSWVAALNPVAVSTPVLKLAPTLADRPLSASDRVQARRPCDPASAAIVRPERSERYSCFRHAAAFGLVGVVERMMKEGINPTDTDSDGNSALMLAAAAGKIEVVETLLRDGRVKAVIASVNATGESALSMTLRRQHGAIIQTLIAAGALRGADANQRSELANHALRYCKVDILNALRQSAPAEIPPFGDGKLATFAVARCGAGQLEQLRNLMLPGPATSAQSRALDLHAMFEATRLGNYAALNLLLGLGTLDPNAVDAATGMTPLAEAIMHVRDAIITVQGEVPTQVRKEIVGLLIRSGADVNKATVLVGTNSSGGAPVANNTPLMLAAATGSDWAVRTLLEQPTPADIDARNASGQTALMLAARRGYRDVVDVLLSPPRGQPADRHLRNRRRESAADLAAEAGYQSIMKLLR